MFQFGRFAIISTNKLVRLPHSEICDWAVIDTYSQLIAVYYVLLRLWEPRHSPCALSNLLFLVLFYFQYVKELNKWYNFIPLCATSTSERSCSTIDCLTNNQLHLFFIPESNRWPLTPITRNERSTIELINNMLFIVPQLYAKLWPLQPLWRISESNRWPSACKADALASWANPPITIPNPPLGFAFFVVPSRFELLTPTLSV